MQHLRRSAAIVATACCLSICSCGGSSTTRSATSGSGTTARTTTTFRAHVGTTPYSFDKSMPPPELFNRGTDYISILKSLSAYSSWVDAYLGNASLLPRYAAPGSTFEKSARHDLDVLERLTRRLYESNSAPADISIVDHRPGLFTARYVQHLVSQTVVDREGRVTSQQKYATPTTTYTILVTQASDGRWLLADVEPVGSN